VRLFDVSDPAHPKVLRTLLAPRTDSAAYRVESAELAGRRYLFVADFGGGLWVWDLTDLAHGVPGEQVGGAFAEWSAPSCLSDDQPNDVYGLALDPVAPGASSLHVYVGVARVGVCLLRFQPFAPPGARLELVELIQTPGGATGVELVPDHQGDRNRLIVSDDIAGLRVYRVLRQ